MSKRKKQTQKQNIIKKIENSPEKDINAEMLSNAITKALLEYDKRKEQEVQDK